MNDTLKKLFTTMLHEKVCGFFPNLFPCGCDMKFMHTKNQLTHTQKASLHGSLMDFTGLSCSFYYIVLCFLLEINVIFNRSSVVGRWIFMRCCFESLVVYYLYTILFFSSFYGRKKGLSFNFFYSPNFMYHFYTTFHFHFTLHSQHTQIALFAGVGGIFYEQSHTHTPGSPLRNAGQSLWSLQRSSFCRTRPVPTFFLVCLTLLSWTGFMLRLAMLR